jgi:hypothetical protein
MRRDQLEHPVRTACQIIDHDAVVVVGSQSILGATMSVEIDILPLVDDGAEAARLADLIEGVAGEWSPFEEQHGFSIDGVDWTTAVAEAADHVMNNDISDLLDQAEHVTERRPAKMVTALRIDLDTHAALEATAAARGTGVTTLMRQIIEDWVRANQDAPALDHISELVRHLDAARQAANSLANRNAA